MHIYFNCSESEYLPVGLEESGGDYEADSCPIRWAWIGRCILASRANRGETCLLAPSKGAGYVANKKIARAVRKAYKDNPLFIDGLLSPIAPTLISIDSSMEVNQLEKIIKNAILL